MRNQKVIREEVKKCLELRNTINETLAKLESQLKELNRSATNEYEISDHQIEEKATVDNAEVPESTASNCDLVLPPGWSRVNLEAGGRMLIRSPGGRTFYTVLAALQSIVRKRGGNFDHEEVAIMRLEVGTILTSGLDDF